MEAGGKWKVNAAPTSSQALGRAARARGDAGGSNREALKTLSSNLESFRSVQKTQWLCVGNPLLAPKDVWCLGRQDPGRCRGHTSWWPRPVRPRVCGSRGGGRGGQGSGQASRGRCGSHRLQLGRAGRCGAREEDGHQAVREQGAGAGGCGEAWRSRPAFRGRRPCLPSCAGTRWARWLRLIPGLGGGRGGSFARVHLGGLWAWAATHRMHPTSASSLHILLFRRLYPLAM